MKTKVFELIQEFIIFDSAKNFTSLTKPQKDQLLVELINDESTIDPDDYYALCMPFTRLLKRQNEGFITPEQVIDRFLVNVATHFKDFIQQQFDEVHRYIRDESNDLPDHPEEIDLIDFTNGFL